MDPLEAPKELAEFYREASKHLEYESFLRHWQVRLAAGMITQEEYDEIRALNESPDKDKFFR